MRISLLAILTMTAVPAWAQMSPASRSSRAYAWEHIIDMGGNDHGTASFERTTSGFEPFDWAFQVEGYTAVQHSSISASEVLVTTRAFGNPMSTFGFGGANSDFSFVFAISNPATFRLEGTVASFIGWGRVSLEGPGLNLLADTPGNQPTPFLFEGTMMPGLYAFSVSSSADYGEAIATLTVVPAPAGALLLGLAAWRRPRR
ncbi:MAG: hypothetical protein DYG92_07430 [Leptolyngbya sp. PLA1]|nr:hypothetical protein [Leptolyngbya sp. PLA1]